MRTWHLYILKVIPCKIFANYGEKNSNFMIGKPSRHHQSPVNKILITSNKVHSHYAPCLCEAMRRACPFSHIPAQNVWSESKREPRINTYLGTFSEKAMTPHSSTLAWKIPWVEEPGRLQSMGSLRVNTTVRLHFHFSLSRIGEGNGNPLQYSCLENPKDGGAWWVAVYGVAQSWTQLKWLSRHILPDGWPTFIESVQRNCHRFQIKEAWQLNAKWDPGLDPGSEKGRQWENWWNSSKICSLANSVMSGLISWFW